MGAKRNVGIIGAGLMGHGIAYLLARAGHQVRVFDASAEALTSLPDRLAGISELFGDDPAIVARIDASAMLSEAVADAGFVVEAALEDVALKQEIFVELERLTPADCILASNTSAIPIATIAEKVQDKARVVGTHFWNPPHLVPLVEVVQIGVENLPAVESTIAILRDAGRYPVHVRKDIPGFIGNRLQHALKREAIALVTAGVCDAETIDDVVKQGFGKRMGVLGPMEQSDLVGLELTRNIQKTLMPDLDNTSQIHPYLLDRIAAGHLGMKTGEGFRKWTAEDAEAVRERLRATLLADIGGDQTK